MSEKINFENTEKPLAERRIFSFQQLSRSQEVFSRYQRCSLLTFFTITWSEKERQGPRILGMRLKWFFMQEGRGGGGDGGERDPSQRPDLAPWEGNGGGAGVPHAGWALTPSSLSTVQMSGRACLSTSWTSKAWKPAARKHKAATEPPRTLDRQVTFPLKGSPKRPRGTEAERRVRQTESSSGACQSPRAYVTGMGSSVMAWSGAGWGAISKSISQPLLNREPQSVFLCMGYSYWYPPC